MAKIKKWRITREASSSIIMEGEQDPLETIGKWDMDSIHGPLFDEMYRDDGISEFTSELMEDTFDNTHEKQIEEGQEL